MMNKGRITMTSFARSRFDFGAFIVATVIKP